MAPLQPTPLSELRENEPTVYDFLQALVRAAIQSSPTLVKPLAAFGIAGEGLHEAMEGLLEKGLVRFRCEGGPALEDATFYLQVYDLNRLAYRDVGSQPWDE